MTGIKKIMKDKILVTGVAGFIGFHLARRLLSDGQKVWGIDNLSPYYDPNLKKARLKQITGEKNFQFSRLDIADRRKILAFFEKEKFDYVVHLAAQAGVRYSLINPFSYVKSNLDGFINILEGCRRTKVKHLLFASSSSVYGANTKMPFSVRQNVDHPLSLYAATKKANELMAHTYSALYQIPTTGLRFFTVYGPWGRPDMALFKFSEAILKNKPIEVYNYGKMERDFTYIDDVVEGIVRLLEKIPRPDKNWSGRNPNPASSFAPYRIYNIGNNQPVNLLKFIEVLEKSLGKKARKKFLPLQPGDVPRTYADVADLEKSIGFRPRTPLAVGIKKFVDWYRKYYQI